PTSSGAVSTRGKRGSRRRLGMSPRGSAVLWEPLMIPIVTSNAVVAACACAIGAVVAGCPPDAHGQGEGEGAGEAEGERPCVTDPILGSLHVEDGFILVQSQGIPGTTIGVGFAKDDVAGTTEMIALTNDLHVVDLGAYPGQTTALPPVVFDALATDDAGLNRTD